MVVASRQQMWFFVQLMDTIKPPSRRSSSHRPHRKLPFLTTSGEASDENFIKETSPPQCFSASWHIESIKTFELCCIISLTHRGLNRMANILQTTFSYLFCFYYILCSFIKLSPKFVPSVLLTMSQQWFRQWLGTAQAASHPLNPTWPRLLMHRCVTRPRWVNRIHQSLITHWIEFGFTDIKIKITNIRIQAQGNIGSHTVCALLWFCVSKLALEQT